MSRLLSEKRIISVDTTSVNANTFEAGACVIDSTNESLHVSDGTNWIVSGTVMSADAEPAFS